MKKIKLTQGKYALVDNADFKWLSRWKWCYSSGGYAKRGTVKRIEGIRKSIQFAMHREIIQTPKGMHTDHIDGNRLNNQRRNLRIVTCAQNKMNVVNIRKHAGKFKGVSWDNTGKRWRARITKDGKEKYIGNFKTKVAAAKAYDAEALLLFKSYAKTNKQLRKIK